MISGAKVRLGHLIRNQHSPCLKLRSCYSHRKIHHLNPLCSYDNTKILCKEGKLTPPAFGHFNNFFTLPGIANKKKEYIGKKIVGFTPEQMFDVVSDVENYKKFVPFCIKSTVTHKTKHLLSGDLQVGFPPIVESYSSTVSLNRPHSVRAVCKDGKIFNHLTTTWKFIPGLKEGPQSCHIHFYLSFEFKSMLHSQLANVFFDELVKQMEWAFVKEAEKRYGKPSLPTVKL
ncbi:coenzyme Q-binding protein COQ10 homolog A, mitochondrial [Cimex lectularius]|uniref:Coenzyme Q-binding protein COQ10 START domain-containing protein n=1 Tax=Cimex lectularius TaxID=79782 RepID=A0A8I6RBH3_CIMLE|nr:coenzyme Q-binding protein COQ10 homolog A, mitochondrial [Cimex lectularius]